MKNQKSKESPERKEKTKPAKVKTEHIVFKVRSTESGFMHYRKSNVKEALACYLSLGDDTNEIVKTITTTEVILPANFKGLDMVIEYDRRQSLALKKHKETIDAMRADESKGYTDFLEAEVATLQKAARDYAEFATVELNLRTVPEFINLVQEFQDKTKS